MSSRDSSAAHDTTELGSSKCSKTDLVMPETRKNNGVASSAPVATFLSMSPVKLLVVKPRPQVLLVRSEKNTAIDCRLVDLAILIAEELPRMNLAHVLAKVRDEVTWKSYLVCDAASSHVVLGGCIIKEHDSGLAELSLMAVRTNA